MSRWLPSLASMVLTFSLESHNRDTCCWSNRPLAPPHPSPWYEAFQNALLPGVHPPFHFPLPLLCSHPQSRHSASRHGSLLSRFQIRSRVKDLLLFLSPQTIKRAHLNPRTLARQSRSEHIFLTVCFPYVGSPSSPQPTRAEKDGLSTPRSPSLLLGGTKPWFGLNDRRNILSTLRKKLSLEFSEEALDMETAGNLEV